MIHRAHDTDRSHGDRPMPARGASESKGSAAPMVPLVMRAASFVPHPEEVVEAISADGSRALDPTTLPAGSNRSLEVLIVTQAVDYGVAVCVRQLTEAAVEAGHSVVVACPGKGPLPAWITSAGARHEPVNMVRHPAPRDLIDLWSIRRLARGRDVLHLHSSKAAALGRVAAASLVRKRPATVVTPHYWSWFVGGKLARLYRLIERILAFQCDAIVAVSEREAAEGRTVLKAGGRILLIHNGIDRIHFSPDGVSAERPSRPLIVCVGRLSEQKGQDLGIRALARIQNKEAVLRLVGGETSGGERRQLEALAKEMAVAHRIEWRGEISDTAPELRAADVVIAPSRWEGMSLALLEAMACGAAVVVTDVTGSEVVLGAGIVVPPNDPGALADAIDALLEDGALRRRLGKAARERSRSYDLAHTMQGNLALWSKLAGEASRAGRRGIGQGQGLLRSHRRAP
jgi:glycosyltransferase involved in cell wall biosynthesis